MKNNLPIRTSIYWAFLILGMLLPILWATPSWLEGKEVWLGAAFLAALPSGMIVADFYVLVSAIADFYMQGLNPSRPGSYNARAYCVTDTGRECRHKEVGPWRSLIFAYVLARMLAFDLELRTPEDYDIRFGVAEVAP